MSNRIQHGMEINAKTEKLLETMPSVVTDWYYNLLASDKTPATCHSYVGGVKRFLEYCGNNRSTFNLQNLSESDVSRYMISIKTKQNKNGEIVEMSGSHRKTTWTILDSFMGYASKRGKIDRNYMEDIDRPSKKDIINRRYFTEEDFQSILEAVRAGAGSERAKARQEKFVSRDLAIMMLFMNTGMRVTALTEIDLDDINFAERKLLITDKGNVTHQYYLTDLLIDVLREWMHNRIQLLDGTYTKALFISNQKKRIKSNTVYNLVKKYSKEGLGYEISPHKLRGGFCTILQKKTNNTKLVAEAVGHKNIATTELYIQTDKKDKMTAAKIMEGLIQ